MLIIVMADTIICKALSKELFILRVLIPVNRNIQNNKAEIPVLNSNEFLSRSRRAHYQIYPDLIVKVFLHNPCGPMVFPKNENL